ncbi:MAG: 23S rRNA (pseudouridine(1915)-N(3))-methyltransferase RlmH [Saprospiraceae bacterium]|nr:23S rRNA (pseudouridine(1915)-N(3))-methyltransferase RlmH [Saprospiraceae bacterium]
MKIEFWVIGKTNFPYLDEGNDIYLNRIKHYVPFQMTMISDIKNRKSLSEDQIKTKEGEIILSKLNSGDFLILMDERGKQRTSVQFSEYLQNVLQQSHKRAIFLIGGAYGFSDAVYGRCNTKMSLSNMTFSHQMVRLIFLEQFYRALTIMNNEPYHHE